MRIDLFDSQKAYAGSRNRNYLDITALLSDTIKYVIIKLVLEGIV